MALPGGENRIDDAMSTVVLSLPAGAHALRANRILVCSVSKGKPRIEYKGN